MRLKNRPLRKMKAASPIMGWQQRKRWRRRWESNPRTGITGLMHFECILLDHLSTPPYMKVLYLPLNTARKLNKYLEQGEKKLVELVKAKAL